MAAFKFQLPADPYEWLANVMRLLDDADQTWRFTKRGDTRPLCDVAASVAAKKRIKAERQKVVMDRILGAARKRNLCRALPGQSIADRMLRAMRPGAWLGTGGRPLHQAGRDPARQTG